jgi:hypothetical protein
VKIRNLDNRLRKLETQALAIDENTARPVDLSLMSVADLTRLAEIGERLQASGHGLLLQDEQAELEEIGKRYNALEVKQLSADSSAG